MTTDKEELRKEFFEDVASKAMYVDDFGWKDKTKTPAYVFDWFYSKLEAKDKECAAKIAAGERLRMEDAMSAINEANGLREKIKEQELIIYGIEEGAEQWKSLCADKDKEIAELKRYNEMQKGGFDFLHGQAKQEITYLKAEREAAKLYADSVARDAWDRACEATLLKIKTTFTDPKNLDKCDNVAILLRDAVKEIGSDILAFPKPEYQPK